MRNFRQHRKRKSGTFGRGGQSAFCPNRVKPMQGILIVDKPAGFTSFDVVAKLRGICDTRKIGHSGTLDPMATGVLPVFIGNAAKAVDLQSRHDKIYEATMLLGTRTDTGDVTGTAVETLPVPAQIDEQAVRDVLWHFLGNSEQLPPMYSAVKVNGQALYKAARKGKIVERTPRPIVVHAISVLAQSAKNEFTLRIHCGKGTYVRVLLEDIGRALGTCATMSALRRTMACGYTLDHAVDFPTLQAAKENGTLPSLLQSVETVFTALPSLTVDDATAQRLLNGAITYRFYEKDGRYRVRSKEEFLGLAQVQNAELRAEKLFVER
ncbi:MAG: tRNA pseudouridine(55) synthase TruB [Ruthenibacterium sp.]